MRPAQSPRLRKQFVGFITIISLAIILVVNKQNDYNDRDYPSPEIHSLRSQNESRNESLEDPCGLWRRKFPSHKPSNTSSFFNCDSIDGKCQYFYPTRFFDSECGIGKDYIDFIKTAKHLQQNGTLWSPPNPYVPLPKVSMTSKDGKQNVITGLPFITQNISFIHVHKTGGTSLVSAFTQVTRKNKFKGQRYMIYNQVKLGTDAYKMGINATSKILDGAVTYQDEWGLNDLLVTAVLRDPIDRFVSAVGQAMGGKGSSLTQTGEAATYRTSCKKNTIPETLRCSIDFILANSTFWELHFTPMALELSFGTMYKNVPVAVFPFEVVPKYLEELGGSSKKQLKMGSTSRAKLLKTMNSTHLDQDMIRDVCNIYIVDVIMMRSLGWEVPRCDKYVTKD
uniref:Sulfotransferase domain-containing protein n=1 Tax=Eucampia antarctica TaxID=49252 RepID=A0A7S2RNK9_9STRA|mmetsp:Transcript_24173/g.23221  ORF Transcript_24173/g.23221 Transcript_24173/m.23221 type:complete len:395 (+) Transcript_24173:1-1185(+)